MNNTRLHIEKHGSYSGVDIFHIRGLTEEETHEIMNATNEGKEKADKILEFMWIMLSNTNPAIRKSPDMRQEKARRGAKGQPQVARRRPRPAAD